MNSQSEADGIAIQSSEPASDSERNIVSRRRVVGLVSAAMGSAWSGAIANAASDSNAPSPPTKTTAELVYNIRDFGARVMEQLSTLPPFKRPSTPPIAIVAALCSCRPAIFFAAPCN